MLKQDRVAEPMTLGMQTILNTKGICSDRFLQGLKKIIPIFLSKQNWTLLEFSLWVIIIVESIIVKSKTGWNTVPLAQHCPLMHVQFPRPKMKVVTHCCKPCEGTGYSKGSKKPTARLKVGSSAFTKHWKAPHLLSEAKVYSWILCLMIHLTMGWGWVRQFEGCPAVQVLWSTCFRPLPDRYKGSGEPGWRCLQRLGD